jgi:endonuclease/exonuclease/phosphatase family metal-dependent hydrolase
VRPPPRLTSAALALVLAAVVLSLSGSPASAASFRYRIFQFNAYDNLGTGTSHTARADAIVSSLVSFGAHFASLNELCRSTGTDIVAKAQARGLALSGYFTQTYAFAGNCPGGSYGNMVLYRGSLVGATVTPLPSGGSSEVRKLTCVATSEPGTLRMCGTHITNNRDLQNQQIDLVRSTVNPYAVAPGGYVIVGGDFNQTPSTSAIQRMYTGYGGYFNEVDRAGGCNDSVSNERTTWSGIFPVKYDYIFVAASRFTCHWGDATSSSVSDHSPLRGEATMTW